MAKHKSQIRSGLLTVGLNRDAFLSVWGMPDRTYTIKSDEFEKVSGGILGLSGVNKNGGGGGLVGKVEGFKGTVPLDVWVYESRGVTLIFKGIELQGWETGKTIKELKMESSKKIEETTKSVEKDKTEATRKELEKETPKKIEEYSVLILSTARVGLKYYHRSDCSQISSYLSYPNALHRLTVEEAVKRGYEPCPFCKP